MSPTSGRARTFDSAPKQRIEHEVNKFTKTPVACQDSRSKAAIKHSRVKVCELDFWSAKMCWLFCKMLHGPDWLAETVRLFERRGLWHVQGCEPRHHLLAPLAACRQLGELLGLAPGGRNSLQASVSRDFPYEGPRKAPSDRFAASQNSQLCQPMELMAALPRIDS